MIFPPSMYVIFGWALIVHILTSLTLNRSVAASSSAWLPLLYDTVIVTLTVIRLYPSIRNQHPSFVVRRLFEDGLLYYGYAYHTT
jgi:hypothetical protein